MLIWILDADISFSVGLKQKIRELLKQPKSKLKIEIFHLLPDFREQAQLVAGKKKKSPDLIFLETHVNEDSTLDFVQHPSCAELHQKFVYCSAMSYGLFQDFYEKQSLVMPFFVQKQRVEAELEKILNDRLLSKENAQEKKKASVGNRRNRMNGPKLKGMLEKQRDLYYQGGVSKKNLEEFVSHLSAIAQLGQISGYPGLGKKSLELAAFMQSTPPPGALRLKREIRDFLGLAEKIGEELE